MTIKNDSYHPRLGKKATVEAWLCLGHHHLMQYLRLQVTRQRRAALALASSGSALYRRPLWMAGLEDDSTSSTAGDPQSHPPTLRRAPRGRATRPRCRDRALRQVSPPPMHQSTNFFLQF
jgi:hypothetical protein